VLIDNAIKYSPRGSDVVVKLTAHDPPVISVRDSGPGIAAADLPHIFKRFYRADPARTTASDQAGFGLGLAIAETIVAAHDGSIAVETAPGAGANFRVLFQAAAVGPETRQWVRS
jgi:two-component system sensor histidine kinase MprB